MLSKKSKFIIRALGSSPNGASLVKLISGPLEHAH